MKKYGKCLQVLQLTILRVAIIEDHGATFNHTFNGPLLMGSN